MNNIVTTERNALFNSKFDACKSDLKVRQKIVNQLLNKINKNFQHILLNIFTRVKLRLKETI